MNENERYQQEEKKQEPDGRQVQQELEDQLRAFGDTMTDAFLHGFEGKGMDIGDRAFDVGKAAVHAANYGISEAGKAMRQARDLGKLIVAHCEDNALLRGGYIHDGAYAKAHGHRGNPSASEWKQVERDLALVEETGCAYHVCHVSTKETVELIRQAKAKGLDVTCETAPHYLVFNDTMLQEEGRFKMNPPIRSEEDRQALLTGILDGTVDMIATDHAPHSAEEKSGGLEKSLNGIVGLETAFPVLYTELVRPGILTLDKLIQLMHTNPAQRFGLNGGLEVGAPADLTVFDLDASYVVDPAEFQSMGKSSPFTGRTVFGKCLLTISNGTIAWQAEGGK